jgi:hypothetical protein
MQGPSAPSASKPNVPLSPPPIPVAPYAWYPAPPTRDTLLPLILIVIALVVGVPIALFATFFGMGAGFSGPTGGPPEFYLGPVDQANGNASVSIWTFEPLSPTNLRFSLQANESGSSLLTLPTPGESAAAVVRSHTLRLFWLDPNHDGSLGIDDVFWITGDRAPLPSATTLRFSVQSVDGSTNESVTWTTGPA